MEGQDMSTKVALDGDELFQKFVARKVVKSQELRVETVHGSTFVGFLTGLDEEWFQLTTTIGYSAVLLRLANITSLTPTGRSIKNLSERERERVEGYAFAIKKSSEEVLDNGKAY